MDKDQIVELISNNRLQEAIEAMEQASRGTHLHNQIILLAASFAEYTQLNRNATQDFQTLEVQRSRIITNLLSLLDDVSREKNSQSSATAAIATPAPQTYAAPGANTSTTKSRKWMWYAGGGLLLVIILIAIFSNGSGEGDEIVPSEVTTTTADESINGQNVSLVYFGDGTKELGEYREESGGWVEKDYADGNEFHFQEASRDEWSVYLYDPARGAKIQLDLYKKSIKYSDNNNTDPFEVYKIMGTE